MSIPTSLIEQIRSRARIEEVIARYVPTLTKRGSNFIGLCPFHREKTPSFTVSPDKQIFHCFGCHAGGNLFSFIGKIENLTFPESVRFVGKLIGISVDEDSVSEDDIYYRINDFAMRLYHQFLLSDEGSGGLNYLLGRGVNEESIKNFRLGFAPDQWDFLKSSFLKKRIDLSKCAELSLLVKKDKDNAPHYFDFFRNRIIFPITERYGKVAGFGGRITGTGEPKYLNSPETRIYRKRDILYGYEQARSEIASLKRAIIVEGYLDVIGCHQVGIKNVVAPLGTALTEGQVKLLAKSAEEIILLFDADSAGLKASLRSINVMKDVNVGLRVAALSHDDPFDYAMKHGVRELMMVIDSAKSPAEFRMEYLTNDIANKGRRQVLMNIFSVIRDLPLEAEKSEYLKVAARYLETDPISLASDFRRFTSGQQISEERKSQVSDTDYVNRCYRELLVLLINNPALIEKATMDFADDKPDSLYGRLFEKLVDLASEHEGLNSEMLFDFFTEPDEREFLEKNVLVEGAVEDPDRAYTEIYVSLRIFLIEQKITYYAELASRDASMEVLLELETWKREKVKLEGFISQLRGTGPRADVVFF